MAQRPGTINPTPSTIALPLDRLDYSAYADIRMRSLSSDPVRSIFDDGDFPCRRLYLYPVPQTQRAVELWLWRPLNTWADLDTDVELPPGYERAVVNNLALELASEYGRPEDPVLVQQAQESHSAIRRKNQRTETPLRQDQRLTPRGSQSVFNARRRP